MSAPRVSIIIPTYNRAGLIGRAIESVVNQTYADWELIVVDDGSTDETADVGADYGARLGEAFLYVKQRHAGASTARNTGIERSRGRFLAFLDEDDEFLPHKLERQVALLERRPGLGLVFCDMSVVGVDGTWARSVFQGYSRLIYGAPAQDLGNGERVCGPDFLDYLVRRYLIPTITGMVRRDVLGDDVRFAPGQSYSEEWLFFLEVARRARCGYIDEPLAVQHQQPVSVSMVSASHNVAQQRQALQMIQARYADVSASAKRAVRHQLAHCCRQLGFDAYKQGRYRDALRHFSEAWAQRPDVHTTVHVVQTAWKRAQAEWTGPQVGPGSAEPTALPEAENPQGSLVPLPSARGPVVREPDACAATPAG